MQHDPHRSLFVQCLRRANAYFVNTGCKPIPSHIEICALWLMKQAIRNRNRIPEDALPNPATGFPDSYLDDILYYAAVEGPFVAALSDQDGEAWESMASLISNRVHTYVRRYVGSPLDRDILEEDVVQICCLDFWDWLESYPYDCRLEAWISQCISRRVLRICTSAGYRRTRRLVSIDRSLNHEDYVLGDVLPDDSALRQFTQVEMNMALRCALKQLPPQQREVILSVLEGEDIFECSRRMGRSRNSIYKLRERARKALRRYMDI
jgi:RNA polymerase sigma factor (sigma-70 family)